MQGYVRPDGRKGIRNVVAVAYLVQCSEYVAHEIVLPDRDRGVNLIGFPGCYPNDYGERIMNQLCTHPNVGAVLIVSLGCEGFERHRLAETVRASGRPVETLVIQEVGGTAKTIEAGRAWVRKTLDELDRTPTAEMRDRRTRGWYHLWGVRRHQRAERQSGGGSRV